MARLGTIAIFGVGLVDGAEFRRVVSRLRAERLVLLVQLVVRDGKELLVVRDEEERLQDIGPRRVRSGDSAMPLNLKTRSQFASVHKVP